MTVHRSLWLLLLLLSFSFSATAQSSRPAPLPAPSPTPAKPAADEKKDPLDQPPVVTHHEIHAGSKSLRYTATTGMMPIRNTDNEVEAHIFFIAYTLEGQSGEKRPLTFSFNGGPGSASVWLHLGAIGPKRVRMQPDGMMPAPPYQLVDNEFTWLDQTDLVSMDPGGTAYSGAFKADLKEKFLGWRAEFDSVAEFIWLNFDRYERWSSPLFLVGESYGTTRAAGISGYLVEHGIAFNGIMLISSVLNFQTLEPGPGNDLPYVLY